GAVPAPERVTPVLPGGAGDTVGHQPGAVPEGQPEQVTIEPAPLCHTEVGGPAATVDGGNPLEPECGIHAHFLALGMEDIGVYPALNHFRGEFDTVTSKGFDEPFRDDRA